MIVSVSMLVVASRIIVAVSVEMMRAMIMNLVRMGVLRFMNRAAPPRRPEPFEEQAGSDRHHNNARDQAENRV